MTSFDSLRIGVWNVQGLCSKTNHKIRDKHLLQEIKKFDILLLTETWTNEMSDMHIECFDHYALHRKRTRGAKRDSGGLAVYYKTYLDKYIELIKTSDDDILWIKLSKEGTGEKDILCITYIIPSNSGRQIFTNDVFCKIQNDISEFDNLYGEDNYVGIITGDMNARTSNVSDYIENDSVDHLQLPDNYNLEINLPTRVNKDDKPVNENGHSLLNFCKSTGYKIVNGRMGDNSSNHTCVTSRGSSVVDYVLLKPGYFTLIDNFYIQSSSLHSDHNVVEFSINVVSNENSPVRKCVEQKYVWDNKKKENFINEISSDDITSKFFDIFTHVDMNMNKENVDQLVRSFTEIICDKADPLFTKTITIKNAEPCPKLNWLSDECLELRNEFFIALNEFRNNCDDTSRLNMTQARSRYVNASRRCRRDNNSKATDQIMSCIKSDSKTFWKLLRKDAPKKQTNLSVNDFFVYFKSVSKPENYTFIPDDDVYEYLRLYNNGIFRELYFEDLSNIITEGEVKTAIKQLKCGKAAGDDLLINEFYIHGCDILCNKICALFNIVFESGNFPSAWSSGTIVPVHKKGSINCVENYRGITLLSTLGKLFTRVLNNRLNFWSETYGILNDSQMGFRKGYSTTDCIFTLHSIINLTISKGSRLYCLFIDFRKAFDFVNRDCLWYKLIKMGMRGKMLNIIKSMYNEAKSKVKHMGILSDEFLCELGVRQGESLSPFLFSIFLNDLSEYLISNNFKGFELDNNKNVSLLLYADDAVIFCESKDDLQKGLDLLYDYCCKWNLIVNTDKTKIVVFRRGGRLSKHENWTYNGENINVSNAFNYLGINLSYTGKFSAAQTTLSDQARKAIFSLKRCTYKLSSTTPQLMCFLFDTLIKPILMYGCEVWGFCPSTVVERVHLQFCKEFLKLRKSSSNFFIYGELGRTPLLIERKGRIIKYWLNLVIYKKHTIMYEVYEKLNNANINTSWVSLIKNTLENLGFAGVWTSQGVQNLEGFLKLCKMRLKDNFIQEWQTSLNDSPEAYIYKHLKSDFNMSTYFTKINIAKYRTAYCQFLCRNHNLAVITGKWHKPHAIPYKDRICQTCNTIEDEYHVILECTRFQDLRFKYIKKYYYTRPSMLKLTQLLSCTNKNVIRNLSVYIYKLMVICRSS